MNYKQINTVAGWIVFSVAATVYILTSEPTTSFWDAGEYIATASRLQVGHPPGAPLFQMLGRFFSLFAFGNELLVARMVNTMSALFSALTVFFLYHTITHMAGKAAKHLSPALKMPVPAIIGSGVVGALAYTFTDSFWFSAVEGEVYAMSSFFTAFVFWAILKWENEYVEKGPGRSVRWLLLIAYMTGLSIGVHLLNLLTIPAIALVVYLRLFNPSVKGILAVLLISVGALALIMNGIIPWIVKLAGWFELFFVNSLGLPFNTGTAIYFLLLGFLVVYGLVRLSKSTDPLSAKANNRRIILHTGLLSLTFLLIGYSSFFMLVIRSNANTPINENEPKNAIALLSYLNREQYGDWPLLYGPYYNAPVTDYEDGAPVYHKNDATGKYEIIDRNEDTQPVFDKRFMTVFPRMWSRSENSHRYFYEQWGRIKGKPVTVEGEKNNVLMKPTFGENLRFFFNYQIQHMYLRYFMWNFAGRQNDRQGMGDDLNGNWISGFKVLDKIRLGPQDDLPESMQNMARNRYYFLPLLLGLMGFLFHVNSQPKDSLVITMLFIMTGLATVVYLNQYAPQPRERDYAYAASFYAFAVWIGLGVMATAAFLQKYLKAAHAGIIAAVLCVSVPTVLAVENWDDHDRSGRYTARDIARNYLESCAPDAILFTLGDNDTFPLWYVQDVEGIRRDVRVVNLSLLNSDWYIGQMKRKVYDADPLPLSLTFNEYKSGSFEIMYLAPDERIKGAVSLSELFEVMRRQPDAFRVQSSFGPVDVLPADEFYLPVDSALVLKNGILPPEEADSVVTMLTWKIKDRVITKSTLVMLNIIATNNWKRPIYFSGTAGSEAWAGLDNYLRCEGMALRLVPVRNLPDEGFDGYVNSTVLYDRLMNRFAYGNMHADGIYLDETNARMIRNIRTLFGRLTKQLASEGKQAQAIEVADRCLKTIPDKALAFDYYMLPLAEGYLMAGEKQKGLDLLEQIMQFYADDLAFYFRFDDVRLTALEPEIRHALMVINGVASLSAEQGNNKLKEKATLLLDKYFEMYEAAGF